MLFQNNLIAKIILLHDALLLEVWTIFTPDNQGKILAIHSRGNRTEITTECKINIIINMKGLNIHVIKT